MASFSGFNKLASIGSAFSQIEKELESAVKDKNFDTDAQSMPSEHDSLPIGEDGRAAEANGSTDAMEDGDEATATDLSGVSSAEIVRLTIRIAKLEAKLDEKTALCAEKDSQIAAVLEEGEQLSIKQADQEKEIRALRKSTREAQAAAEVSEKALADARDDIERTARRATAQASAAADEHSGRLTEALARAERAEAELVAGRDELEAARERASSLTEEYRALGLAHASAEAREAVVAEALREVQVENARLIEAGRWRDEGLTNQLGELSARTDAAEVCPPSVQSPYTHACRLLSRDLSPKTSRQLQGRLLVRRDLRRAVHETQLPGQYVRACPVARRRMPRSSHLL